MNMVVNKKALAAFVQQCLDPLPDAVLIDTQHNQLMRRVRVDRWRKASFVTDLAKAEREYHSAKGLHAQWVLGDGSALAEYNRVDRRCLEMWRQAIADQIRAPAPDRQAIQWKRSAAKDSFLPIDAAEIAKIIEADEAFLAAHPITKLPRRRRAE
jgi:hypothetical protein